MKKANPRKKREIDQMRQLFGEAVVYIASLADPIDLDLSESLMDRIHDAADRLMTLSGSPAEQVRYVSAMPFETRLVLCMWLMDTNLAAKMIRTVYAKA